MNKICRDCNIEKPIEDFHKNKQMKDGYLNSCKLCRKKYSQDNKDKISERHSSERYKKYHKEWYIKNRNRILEDRKEKYNPENNRQYKQKNKNRISEYNKNYSVSNKDRINDNRKKRRDKNPEKYRKQKREYDKLKKSIDPQTKIACNLRSRTSLAISGKYKSGSAIRDLGCSLPELKIYIENQFQEGMSWENYGRDGWNIDHRIPLAKFDLTDREQFLKACNYTNLRPMWATDNFSKNDRILPEDIEYGRSLGVSV